MYERFAVPYLRVSTDDKGQLPERQLELIRPWAVRESLGLLKPAVDEGVSGSKTMALARPAFVEACERAVAAGAEAVVMEVPDRFSRQDPDVAIWEKVEVHRRFGLRLYFACMPLDMQTTTIGKLLLFAQSAQGHQWVEDHSRKVASGMALRKSQGSRFGRKPKELRDGELDLIRTWRDEGHGWPTVTNLLNAERGIHLLTNEAARKRKSISESALKRLWKRVESSDSGQNGSSVQ